MKTTTQTITDARINRDHCWGQLIELANEIAGKLGIAKTFEINGCLAWNYMESHAYQTREDRTQVDLRFDFNQHTATFTTKDYSIF